MDYRLALGDVIDVLRSIPSGSFHGAFCDPPYGLTFMGKGWDKGVPPAAVWAEVLRCLKPGGFLLAFGGSRTSHRLTCAIEDAGFEIRDSIVWLYGSGFPKSHDLSKAIDRAAGAEREVIGMMPVPGFARSEVAHGKQNRTKYEFARYGAPATAEAQRWAGYGTALKPAHEPIIVAMRPLDGTFAENALKHGVAGLNIDASRIGTTDSLARVNNDRASWGTYGSGPNKAALNGVSGRWPANLILDSESAAALDAQSGELGKSSGTQRQSSNSSYALSGKITKAFEGPIGHGDSGGASRFFYTAKASRSERGNGNTHPCVKPLKLTEYLARLILPPAGDEPRRLLVPFCGSGSEMLGAIAAGWNYILGIDNSEEYLNIARRRIEGAPMRQEQLALEVELTAAG